MPGVYLEYIKAGKFVVPVELTFQTETIPVKDDVRGLVNTSKWIERHNWKEIKAMLKPAVEACLKYNETPLEIIPKSHHISYGENVSLGYLIVANQISTPFLSVLDAKKNCWTDDEDDEDELLGIGGESVRLEDHGAEYTEFIPTKTAIRVCVVRKSTVSIDNARRIRKELGVRSDDVRNYFQSANPLNSEPGPSSMTPNQHPENNHQQSDRTNPSPPGLNSRRSDSSNSSDSEEENIPRTFGDPDEIREAALFYPHGLNPEADSGEDPDDDISLPDIEPHPPKRKKGPRSRKKSASLSPSKSKRLTHNTHLQIAQEGQANFSEEDSTYKRGGKKTKRKRTVAVVEPMRTLSNGQMSFEHAIGSLGNEKRRKARPGLSHGSDKLHFGSGRSKQPPAIDIIAPDDDRLTITDPPLESIPVVTPSTSNSSLTKEPELELEKKKSRRKKRRRRKNIDDDSYLYERLTPSPFDDNDGHSSEEDQAVTDVESDLEMPILTKMVDSEDEGKSEEKASQPVENEITSAKVTPDLKEQQNLTSSPDVNFTKINATLKKKQTEIGNSKDLNSSKQASEEKQTNDGPDNSNTSIKQTTILSKQEISSESSTRQARMSKTKIADQFVEVFQSIKGRGRNANSQALVVASPPVVKQSVSPTVQEDAKKIEKVCLVKKSSATNKGKEKIANMRAPTVASPPVVKQCALNPTQDVVKKIEKSFIKKSLATGKKREKNSSKVPAIASPSITKPSAQTLIQEDINKIEKVSITKKSPSMVSTSTIVTIPSELNVKVKKKPKLKRVKSATSTTKQIATTSSTEQGTITCTTEQTTATSTMEPAILVEEKLQEKPKMGDAQTQTDDLFIAAKLEARSSSPIRTIMKVSRSCDVSSEDDLCDMSQRSRTPVGYLETNRLLPATPIHHPALGSPNRDFLEDDGLFSFESPTVPTPSLSQASTSQQNIIEILIATDDQNFSAEDVPEHEELQSPGSPQPGCSHWITSPFKSPSAPLPSDLMPPPISRPPKTPRKLFEPISDSPHTSACSQDLFDEDHEVDSISFGVQVTDVSQSVGKLYDLMKQPSVFKAGMSLIQKMSSKRISSNDIGRTLGVGGRKVSTTTQQNGIDHIKALVPISSVQRKRDLSPDICEIVPDKRLKLVITSARRSRKEAFEDSTKNSFEECASNDAVLPGNTSPVNDVGSLVLDGSEAALLEYMSKMGSGSSYEPQGDEFDLSQRSICMIDHVTQYPMKSRLYKMHAKAVRETPVSELAEHFKAIKHELCEIFEGRNPSLRHKIFLRGLQGKRDLRSLSLCVPFTSDQSTIVINLINHYVVPEALSRCEYLDYINYVLRPEALIRIYSRINIVPYHMAEIEMRFRACYEGEITDFISSPQLELELELE